MRTFFNKYKKTLLYGIIIIVILIVVIAIGFPLGFLSTDPDGLERTIIDAQGEQWLENLGAFWYPILSWIENEYIAGILGITITLGMAIGIFSLLKFVRNKKRKVNPAP
jgi:hypothetical protein